jgi:hypothetical protein
MSLQNYFSGLPELPLLLRLKVSQAKSSLELAVREKHHVENLSHLVLRASSTAARGSGLRQ